MNDGKKRLIGQRVADDLWLAFRVSVRNAKIW